MKRNGRTGNINKIFSTPTKPVIIYYNRHRNIERIMIMSWYYNYYLGYEKDDKVYPLGPYDVDGKIHPIFSVSRSFASDLHEDFYFVGKEKFSDKAIEALGYEGTLEELWMLPINELGSDDFIKRGYFLTRDVQEYLKDGDSYDRFYESLSPEVFAAKVANESKMGPPQPKKDIEGNEIEVYSANEYMYFAYPDYNSREYEVFKIRNALDMFRYAHATKDGKVVILMTQG